MQTTCVHSTPTHSTNKHTHTHSSNTFMCVGILSKRISGAGKARSYTVTKESGFGWMRILRRYMKSTFKSSEIQLLVLKNPFLQENELVVGRREKKEGVLVWNDRSTTNILIYGNLTASSFHILTLSGTLGDFQSLLFSDLRWMPFETH